MRCCVAALLCSLVVSMMQCSIIFRILTLVKTCTCACVHTHLHVAHIRHLELSFVLVVPLPRSPARYAVSAFCERKSLWSRAKQSEIEVAVPLIVVFGWREKNIVNYCTELLLYRNSKTNSEDNTNGAL